MCLYFSYDLNGMCVCALCSSPVEMSSPLFSMVQHSGLAVMSVFMTVNSFSFVGELCL